MFGAVFFNIFLTLIYFMSKKTINTIQLCHIKNYTIMKEIILQEVNTFLHERDVYNYASGNKEATFTTNLKNDLSFDSLEIAELICEMENIFGVDVSSHNNLPITVGELCDMIDDEIQKNPDRKPFSDEVINQTMDAIEKKVKQLAYSSQASLIIVVSKNDKDLKVKHMF